MPQYKITHYDSAEEIIQRVQSYFALSGRETNRNDIINYLILLSSNFITVFAGKPGTGKTSTCNLLAKALGLNKHRYADISVGRGWTSSRDLIGYYNPLTHSIEKTQPKFSACLETMTKEAATGLSDAMYLVLLDEANLSPIEHYWSEFNKISDDFGGKQIELSESTKYTVVDELRFVATINYDHTTEILSPRFLDRVWIVMMNSPNSKDLLDEKISTNYAEELEDIVSFQDLKSYFTIEGEGFQQKQISFFVKEVLNLIINEFHAAGHSINSRSILAIRNYCIVAEQYIQDEKQIVVDYAVAQKLLPCIEGNGPSYGEFLEKISKICRDHQLLKSEMIVNKIIANGKVEHNYFSYFNL